MKASLGKHVSANRPISIKSEPGYFPLLEFILKQSTDYLLDDDSLCVG